MSPPSWISLLPLTHPHPSRLSQSPTQKKVVRCHEVGGHALTVCVWSGRRASSILVKGSANLLHFHTTLLRGNLTLSQYVLIWEQFLFFSMPFYLCTSCASCMEHASALSSPNPICISRFHQVFIHSFIKCQASAVFQALCQELGVGRDMEQPCQEPLQDELATELRGVRSRAASGRSLGVCPAPGDLPQLQGTAEPQVPPSLGLQLVTS